MRHPAGADTQTATVAGVAAGAVLLAAVFMGSRHLHNFDVALLGYAVGTVLLAAGSTYRVVAWAKGPAARRYLARGWKAILRPGPSGSALESSKTVGSVLLLQRFISERSTGRWLAHQALFWGVITATLITFPLTFGWVQFRSVAGTPSGYWVYLMGIRTLSFDALSIVGFVVFHGLNLSAALVASGAAYYLFKRWAGRGSNLTKFGRDLMPLIALIAISITGLALTASSAWFGGAGYRFLAFIHMCTVVLTLIWIPFGKFFHTVQRPAMIGVQLHKQASLKSGGSKNCRRCGEPLEGAVFLGDLQLTMTELGLGYPGWVETCPRCKRLERAVQYRENVKAGF